VVRDNINSERSTLEIMTTMSKAIKNSKEFLIVCVIVAFWSCKCLASEIDRMEFAVVSKNEENARNTGNPMKETRSSRKCAFESVKG
jgi:hypothetical protein